MSKLIAWMKVLFSIKYTKYFFTRIRFDLQKKNDQAIYKKLNMKLCEGLYPAFKDVKIKNYFNASGVKKLSNVVFVYWHTGEDTMPKIVKECYERLKKTTRFEVILITSNNIKQYSTINDDIYNLYLKGDLSIQMFSDILRINLLSIHEAIWVDATLFLKEDFPIDIFKYDFISPYAGKDKSLFDNKPNLFYIPDLSLSQIYFMAGTNKNIFITWYNFLVSYYLNEPKIIKNVRPYFINYYAFEYLLNYNDNFKPLLSHRNISNINVESINGFYNEIYTDKLAYIFEGDTYILKLSNKTNYNKTINGKLTVYGEFCRRYNFDQD